MDIKYELYIILSFIWNDQIPINRLLLKSIVRQK